ncbi:outer membrane beta-barrel protein [Mangrovibacterium lignilyticum]|uniref:outer membrane beta-barrel protein n=1 Tax=Mangrovibacterium lignilyticum TaxID=2668052 RepID=UPI0013CF53EC|nr:outer membrane beta-barrel protein [Mangrovibacterium lignilyticum]
MTTLLPLLLAAQKNQSELPERKGSVMSANVFITIPQSELKNELTHDGFLGVNIDYRMHPLRRAPYWSLGPQFEYTASGSEENEYDGETTSLWSGYFTFNLLNHFEPNRDMNFKPFAEAGIGLAFSHDRSEIRDPENRFEFRGPNFSAGLGVTFVNAIALQVRYNYLPNMHLLLPSNNADYELTTATFQTFSITLGITIHSTEDADSSEFFESLSNIW